MHIKIASAIHLSLLIHHEKSALFTALFTNTRILKFKSQLTIAFFAPFNHLIEPFSKQNFTLTGSKGHFDPFCVFLCFKVRCL